MLRRLDHLSRYESVRPNDECGEQPPEEEEDRANVNVNASLQINKPQQSQSQSPSPPPPAASAFFMLGLLNNASYVIMLASAKNISEGGTALVFLSCILPSLTLKASAPYWFDRVSYHTRMTLASTCMAVAFFWVALFSNSSNNNSSSTITKNSTLIKTAGQLMGVAMISLQCGLGEASLLALAGKCDKLFATTTPTTSTATVDTEADSSHHTDIDETIPPGPRSVSDSISIIRQKGNNRHITHGAAMTTSTSTAAPQLPSQSRGRYLTYFSSGTGLSGPFGFFWKIFFNEWLHVSMRMSCTLAACTLALLYGYTYHARLGGNIQLNLLTTKPHTPANVSIASDRHPRSSTFRRQSNHGSSLSLECDDNDDVLPVFDGSETTTNNNTSTAWATTDTTTESALIPCLSTTLDLLRAQDHDRTNGRHSGGCIRDQSSPVFQVVAEEPPRMTPSQRFRLVVSLWPYTIPLFTVYAAEYACQAGAWTAIGFPVHNVAERNHFYFVSNWLYQLGVFCSRSSGTLFTVSVPILWLMPALQVLNLVFFAGIALLHTGTPSSALLYNETLFYGVAFYTGLLGGAVYVHGYVRIVHDIAPAHTEFALASVSVAESLGILLADVAGLLLQSCIYATNHIEGALLSCPFL